MTVPLSGRQIMQKCLGWLVSTNSVSLHPIWRRFESGRNRTSTAANHFERARYSCAAQTDSVLASGPSANTTVLGFGTQYNTAGAIGSAVHCASEAEAHHMTLAYQHPAVCLDCWSKTGSLAGHDVEGIACGRVQLTGYM